MGLTWGGGYPDLVVESFKNTLLYVSSTENKDKLYKYMYIYITNKNFGLIHVYFLYTVFRATYRVVISKVT